MKNLLLFCLVLTTLSPLCAQVFPVETVLDNGLPSKRIKFVFLSDGYQSGELPTYITQVNAFKDDVFTQTPFKQYKNFFNFYAIKVPSVESGADHPGTASDESSSGGQPVVTANTYFNSTFDYAGTHRLVVPQNGTAINDVMAANFPSYNQVVVLVNSSYYGGSGGANATSTVNSSANEIAIHEIGHSFAFLADEYAIGGQGERPNRTIVTNPATIKWKNWLGSNGIGIYPIGVEGWQRPHENCKMQFLGVPFCAVCAEAFVNKIYALVTPIYSYAPTAASVSVSSATTFSAVLTQPIPNTLVNEWKLNGTTIASNAASVTVNPNQLNTGSNTLTLYVTDQTTLSRSYLPNSGYVFSQTWTLLKSLPLELLHFEASKVKDDVLLHWRTTNEQQSAYFEIQRSTDGSRFVPIGKVTSTNQAGTNDYHFTDPRLPAGTLYYRLQQFDLDGRFTFSPVRTIDKSDKFYYQMSPNPVRDVLTISGNADYAMDLGIEVYNEAGALVYQHREAIEAGSYAHPVDMASLAAGLYRVVLRLPNGFSMQESIVKGR